MTANFQELASVFPFRYQQVLLFRLEEQPLPKEVI